MSSREIMCDVDLSTFLLQSFFYFNTKKEYLFLQTLEELVEGTKQKKKLRLFPAYISTTILKVRVRFWKINK